MRDPARLCVVGSINMDLVVRAERFPAPGETLLGGPFATYPGGKGANQAVAAVRLGAAVSMIGCVGDLYGTELLRILTGHGVDTRGMERRDGVASGVGVITVTPSGENAIVVAPGANRLVGAAEVRAHAGLIRAADAVLLQHETTDEANETAIGIARESGTTVVLNAAPARPLPRELLSRVDVLIVNRAEAETLVGRDGGAAVERLLGDLLGLGVAWVVITLGAEGAVLAGGGRTAARPAFPVEAVDTTACGDAFVGALAVALTGGEDPEEALRFACAAGALAATSPGAMPSLPDRGAVADLLGG